jgi:hypothetical protein
VDGPSNERCRKEGEEMDAGETRQGMGRQGQMEISLQQSTQEIGNDLRKKKKKIEHRTDSLKKLYYYNTFFIFIFVFYSLNSISSIVFINKNFWALLMMI